MGSAVARAAGRRHCAHAKGLRSDHGGVTLTDVKRSAAARVPVPFLAAALASTCATSARANAPAPLVRMPSNEGGAFVAKQTSLVVEREELTFRCDGETCAFSAVYHVLNPGDVREEVLGAFYGIAADHLSATTDGADARRTLSGDQLRTIDDAAAAIDPDALKGDVTRQGFWLGVDPHARATLVFSGQMHPVVFDTRADVLGEFAIPPLWTRHPWLGTTARADTTDEFAYALSPIRSWAGSPTIDVAVHVPSARYWPAGQQGWTTGEGDGDFVARRSIAATDASRLTFSVVRPGTTLLNGGPVVGLGAGLDSGTVRGRLGYEIAIPWWVIWSAAVETDFQGTTTIVPLGEVATPDLIVLIPSVGLGAGVPVQIRSGAGTYVGARMQLTVSFPVLSLVVPVDVFPGAPTRTWQVGLLGQASF